MSKLFLVSGLGADGRIFNNLDFTGYDVTRIDWPEPNKFDTLRIYAQRLVDHYHIPQGSIVIGNSLGGMIGIEIAKIVKLKKTILISTIKTIDEAPGYFKVFQKVPVYNIIPENLLHSVDFVIERFFGAFRDEDSKLFGDMLKGWSTERLQWAMGAALHWDNTIIPENTYHINGDKDLVFPTKKIKDVIIVKGGTHIMMYDMPVEMNIILKGILNNEITPIILP
jgi:pimeloyl-ACP methyl ester carboxylesterase